MPAHTPAEREKNKKKKKKASTSLFRRLLPGQLGKDILGDVNKKLKDVGKKKKK